MADTIQGTAVIMQSKRDPGVKDADETSWRDDGLLNFLAVEAAGMPYAFVLEVTIPGREPYQTSVETRVPTKAENVGFLQNHPIPLTLEVPVVVDAEDPTRVRIDWKAFLALPDRIPRLKAARERALAITQQRRAAANPDQYAEQRAMSKGLVAGWAEGVVSGQLTRADFETYVQDLLSVGYLDRADYDAAVARIEAV